MKIVVSTSVAAACGKRVRQIVPGAKLVVPSVSEGALAWRGDPAAPDVCCLSEDMWQDLEQRRHVLPAMFQLEGVRWLHTFSAGVDSPAFQAIIDRGTLLTNSSGASAPSIAQYVLAMMLARVKPLDAWRQQQHEHEWLQLNPSELTGQTAVIVGTGAIGGEVARLAKAFACASSASAGRKRRRRSSTSRCQRAGVYKHFARPISSCWHVHSRARPRA